METSRPVALRVGLLVTAGLVLAFVVAVFIGRSGLWFREKLTLHTYFPDVVGLEEGAIVRLAGRDVGIVTDIRFSDEEDPDRAVVVTYRVPAEHARVLRQDSLARIGEQGLVGIKHLSLSVGTPGSPPVPDEGWVVGERPADPSELLSIATEAAQHGRDILARFDRLSAGLDGRGVASDLQVAILQLRQILERVTRGPGLAHLVLFDRDFAAKMADLVASVDRSVDEVGGAADEVRRVTAALNLDPPAPDLLVNAGRAARDLARVAEAIDPGALRQASHDVAVATGALRDGRGTLGALLMDPTLYEEAKRVLVNVRRNRVLTTLARWAIAKDSSSDVMDARPDVVEAQARSVRPRPGPRESGKVPVKGKGP